LNRESSNRESIESRAAGAWAVVPHLRPISRFEKSLAPAAVMAMLVAAAPCAYAQSGDKPYDDRLMRLSEILGAMHYLRELCGANEGQVWRDKMRELLEAEGSSALRRARFTRSFNQGYQSYSKTHRVCTSTAQTAITRFMSEGVQIAEGLVRSIP
jgi:uncharacterized protein (TIGR02301 family)